jgi:hypothetical protein
MGWQCTGDGKAVGCQLGKSRGADKCMDNGQDGNSAGSEDEGDDMDAIECNQPDAEVEKMLDGEGDDDYEYEEPDEAELLEFQSDDEMPDSEDNDHMDIYSDPEIDTHDMFKRANLSPSGNIPPPKHKCFRGKGYNGKFITAEEMTGCCTAQCLLIKASHNAEAQESDDQDFEIASKFCLTGLCGHVRSRDSGGESFSPSRHGVGDAMVESWV